MLDPIAEISSALATLPDRGGRSKHAQESGTVPAPTSPNLLQHGADLIRSVLPGAAAPPAPAAATPATPPTPSAPALTTPAPAAAAPAAAPAPAAPAVATLEGAGTAAAEVAAGSQPDPAPQPDAQTSPAQDPAVPPPAAAPKAEPGTLASIGNWFTQNYDLAALPIGLGLMMFGGKVGTVLGALALGGGAYGLWNRFETLNNVGGKIEVPEGLNDEQAQAHRTQVIQERIQALQAAAAGGQDSAEWKAWYGVPENQSFYDNLSMVNNYMPGVMRDVVRTRFGEAANQAVDNAPWYSLRAAPARAARAAFGANAVAGMGSRRAVGHNVMTDDGYTNFVRSLGLGQQQQQQQAAAR